MTLKRFLVASYFKPSTTVRTTKSVAFIILFVYRCILLVIQLAENCHRPSPWLRGR